MQRRGRPPAGSRGGRKRQWRRRAQQHSSGTKSDGPDGSCHRSLVMDMGFQTRRAGSTRPSHAMQQRRTRPWRASHVNESRWSTRGGQMEEVGTKRTTQGACPSLILQRSCLCAALPSWASDACRDSEIYLRMHIVFCLLLFVCCC
jgi:hypothetical protein